MEQLTKHAEESVEIPCHMSQVSDVQAESVEIPCHMPGVSDVQAEQIFHVCLSEENAESHDYVSEVFSLPRVVPLAEKYGFKQGRSYDIRSGFDFRKAEARKRCLEELRLMKPKLVMISPPCCEYFVKANLNDSKRDPRESERRKIEARVLLSFAMQVCACQHELGGYFIMEQPAYATSWQESVVQHVWSLPGVHDVVLSAEQNFVDDANLAICGFPTPLADAHLWERIH